MLSRCSNLSVPVPCHVVHTSESVKRRLQFGKWSKDHVKGLPVHRQRLQAEQSPLNGSRDSFVQWQIEISLYFGCGPRPLTVGKYFPYIYTPRKSTTV